MYVAKFPMGVYPKKYFTIIIGTYFLANLTLSVKWILTLSLTTFQCEEFALDTSRMELALPNHVINAFNIFSTKYTEVTQTISNTILSRASKQQDHLYTLRQDDRKMVSTSRVSTMGIIYLSKSASSSVILRFPISNKTAWCPCSDFNRLNAKQLQTDIRLLVYTILSSVSNAPTFLQS